MGPRKAAKGALVSKIKKKPASGGSHVFTNKQKAVLKEAHVFLQRYGLKPSREDKLGQAMCDLVDEFRTGNAKGWELPNAVEDFLSQWEKLIRSVRSEKSTLIVG